MTAYRPMLVLVALASVLGGLSVAYGGQQPAGASQDGGVQPSASEPTMHAEQPAVAPAADGVVQVVAPVSRARENYRIGPGDVLEVRVLGEDKMTSVVKVTGEGFIRFPYIDSDVMAQCLSERELGLAIGEKLKKYLKYPEVFVAVKEYNSSPIAIMGAVNTPGRFQMQRSVRLIELLSFAGGVKSDAGRVVSIIHTTGNAACASAPEDGASANMSDAAEAINLARLLEGDPASDRVMRPGDIVIVPVADLVFVAGEVLKPNAYPLREGMTLSQVLALAGGPSGVAKTDAVRIVRQEPGQPKQEIPVDLQAIQTNKAPDVVLMANDVIEIPGSSGKKFMRGFLSAIGGSAGQLPLRAIP